MKDIILNDVIKKCIETGCKKIEDNHPELTIYLGEKQFKDWYVIGQFDGDINALQVANGGSEFFKDNGDYPKGNYYILYTTCCNDDHIYTNMLEFEEEFNILSYMESHFLSSVGIYLNQPYLDPEKYKSDKEIIDTILEFGKGE